MFFPRIAGSFWGAPSAERALSGLTEEMSPGDISDLTLNDVVAFRVRFSGNAPPPPERYWRGPVLNEFDGYTWYRGDAQSLFRPAVEPCRGAGRLHRHARTDRPADAVRARHGRELDGGHRGAVLGLRAKNAQARQRRLRYDARSYTSYNAGVSLSAALRNLSLQLPAGRNPRTVELARSMRSAAATTPPTSQAVLELFREQEFLLHADAAGSRARFSRRFHVQHAPGLLWALRVGLHDDDARSRNPRARRRRLPGRPLEPGRRLPDRAPVACACLDRSLVCGRGLATRRPHGRGRAGAHRTRHRGLVRGIRPRCAAASCAIRRCCGRRTCSGTI